jgi:hypothetical protein
MPHPEPSKFARDAWDQIKFYYVLVSESNKLGVAVIDHAMNLATADLTARHAKELADKDREIAELRRRMSESKTPRTDEVAGCGPDWVRGDHARTLETELAASRAEIERLKDAWNGEYKDMQARIDRLKAERDGLRNALNRFAVSFDAYQLIPHGSECRREGFLKICDARNTARAALSKEGT